MNWEKSPCLHWNQFEYRTLFVGRKSTSDWQTRESSGLYLRASVFVPVFVSVFVFASANMLAFFLRLQHLPSGDPNLDNRIHRSRD